MPRRGRSAGFGSTAKASWRTTPHMRLQWGRSAYSFRAAKASPRSTPRTRQTWGRRANSFRVAKAVGRTTPHDGTWRGRSADSLGAAKAERRPTPRQFASSHASVDDKPNLVVRSSQAPPLNMASSMPASLTVTPIEASASSSAVAPPIGAALRPVDPVGARQVHAAVGFLRCIAGRSRCGPCKLLRKAWRSRARRWPQPVQGCASRHRREHQGRPPCVASGPGGAMACVPFAAAAPPARADLSVLGFGQSSTMRRHQALPPQEVFDTAPRPPWGWPPGAANVSRFPRHYAPAAHGGVRGFSQPPISLLHGAVPPPPSPPVAWVPSRCLLRQPSRPSLVARSRVGAAVEAAEA